MIRYELVEAHDGNRLDDLAGFMFPLDCSGSERYDILDELGYCDPNAAGTVEMDYASRLIAGPAGHWYALLDWSRGSDLMGYPMPANVAEGWVPPHPSVDLDGWYQITEPAPECDDAAIIAELEREHVVGAGGAS